MLEKKQIAPHQIDIWQTHLIRPEEDLHEMLLSLSDDEKQRAERFHFPIHRHRFIIARATLRLILASYVNDLPGNLTFGYSEHDKPFLCHPDTSIQFNLSHSDEIAVYAITHHQPVGIDIELIKPEYNAGVAQRFFSLKENQAIEQLPDYSQPEAFYQIWARKEAIVKAVGKGLNLPLSSFSVTLDNHPESIQLTDYPILRLIPLNLHPEYASAVCCEGIVQKISIYKLIGQISQLEKSYDF